MTPPKAETQKPGINPQPPVVNSKTDDQLKAEIDQLRAQSAGEVDEFQAVQSEMETKQLRENLGLDLDFDIEKFITEGVVEKKGIKLFDGVYADMHTLTKSEDFLCDEITTGVLKDVAKQAANQSGEKYDEKSGVPRDDTYFRTRSLATAAMAITRLNNKLYPSPGDFRTPDKDKLALKKSLLEYLVRLPNKKADWVLVIYSNLEIVDILTGQVPDVGSPEADAAIAEVEGEQGPKKAS